MRENNLFDNNFYVQKSLTFSYYFASFLSYILVFFMNKQSKFHFVNKQKHLSAFEFGTEALLVHLYIYHLGGYLHLI